jgi:hypothetical protein
MTLYEHLSVETRHAVDDLVEDFRDKTWSTRFLALIEKLNGRTDPDPSLLLQQWTGLVAAVLEYLPPDAAIAECFALMSISYNDQWRAQALAQIDRDPTVLDRLLAAYPMWDDIVERFVDADRKRPIRK